MRTVWVSFDEEDGKDAAPGPLIKSNVFFEDGELKINSSVIVPPEYIDGTLVGDKLIFYFYNKRSSTNQSTKMPKKQSLLIEPLQSMEIFSVSYNEKRHILLNECICNIDILIKFVVHFCKSLIKSKNERKDYSDTFKKIALFMINEKFINDNFFLHIHSSLEVCRKIRFTAQKEIKLTSDELICITRKARVFPIKSGLLRNIPQYVSLVVFNDDDANECDRALYVFQRLSIDPSLENFTDRCRISFRRYSRSTNQIYQQQNKATILGGSYEKFGKNVSKTLRAHINSDLACHLYDDIYCEWLPLPYDKLIERNIWKYNKEWINCRIVMNISNIENLINSFKIIGVIPMHLISNTVQLLANFVLPENDFISKRRLIKNDFILFDKCCYEIIDKLILQSFYNWQQLSHERFNIYKELNAIFIQFQNDSFVTFIKSIRAKSFIVRYLILNIITYRILYSDIQNVEIQRIINFLGLGEILLDEIQLNTYVIRISLVKRKLTTKCFGFSRTNHELFLFPSKFTLQIYKPSTIKPIYEDKSFLAIWNSLKDSELESRGMKKLYIGNEQTKILPHLKSHIKCISILLKDNANLSQKIIFDNKNNFEVVINKNEQQTPFVDKIYSLSEIHAAQSTLKESHNSIDDDVYESIDENVFRGVEKSNYEEASGKIYFQEKNTHKTQLIEYLYKNYLSWIDKLLFYEFQINHHNEHLLRRFRHQLEAIVTFLRGSSDNKKKYMGSMRSNILEIIDTVAEILFISEISGQFEFAQKLHCVIKQANGFLIVNYKL